MIYEFVDVKEHGKPITHPKHMIALFIYGAYVILMKQMNWMNDTDHQKIRHIRGDLKPSGRVLHKFVQEYCNIFKQMLAGTLNLAYSLGLTILIMFAWMVLLLKPHIHQLMLYIMKKL